VEDGDFTHGCPPSAWTKSRALFGPIRDIDGKSNATTDRSRRPRVSQQASRSLFETPLLLFNSHSLSRRCVPCAPASVPMGAAAWSRILARSAAPRAQIKCVCKKIIILLLWTPPARKCDRLPFFFHWPGAHCCKRSGAPPPVVCQTDICTVRGDHRKKNEIRGQNQRRVEIPLRDRS
jgi:hypothetical protein